MKRPFQYPYGSDSAEIINHMLGTNICFEKSSCIFLDSRVHVWNFSLNISVFKCQIGSVCPQNRPLTQSKCSNLVQFQNSCSLSSFFSTGFLEITVKVMLLLRHCASLGQQRSYIPMLTCPNCYPYYPRPVCSPKMLLLSLIKLLKNHRTPLISTRIILDGC